MAGDESSGASCCAELNAKTSKDALDAWSVSGKCNAIPKYPIFQFHSVYF